jgi:cytochrome c oxidase subunit 4
MNADSARADFFVWIALLCLLALTCGSAFIPLGSMNLIANVVIAAIKAVLVAVFFMGLGRRGPLVRLVAIAGLVWLAFLVALSVNDFATRAV